MSEESKLNRSSSGGQLVLAPEAVQSYNDFIASLSAASFYGCDFRFHLSQNVGLTKDEFTSLMSLYNVPPEKTYGDRGYTITINFEQKGNLRKTILIFTRKQKKYNVLIAEATQKSHLEWKKLGGTVVVCAVVSIGLGVLAAPAAGLGVGVVCLLGIGGKTIYDKKHQNFKDETIGYLLTELQKVGKLRIQGDRVLLIDHGDEYDLSNPDGMQQVNPNEASIEEIDDDDDNDDQPVRMHLLPP